MTSTPTDSDPVIAVLASPSAAQACLKALSQAHFDMTKVSIIGRSRHPDGHVHGFYTLGDRIRAWGASGGFWGAAWALLVGSAVFMLPPVGLVAAAGPITLALVSALEGAIVVGGVSALSAALAGIGLSHEKAVQYEADILADRFLVTVHGSPEEVDRARALLADSAGAPPLPFHQAA